MMLMCTNRRFQTERVFAAKYKHHVGNWQASSGARRSTLTA